MPILVENAGQSECYAKYRLSAPETIVDKIMLYLSEKLAGPYKHALDVGCGTGQGTRILAPYFDIVTGTDVSETQIFEARRQPDTPDNVQYEIAPAESLQFGENSLQLITASTSYHWFDEEKFMRAAKTMLQDKGVLAIYVVHRPFVKGGTEQQTQKIKSLIEKIDDEFWKHVDGRNDPNWRRRGGLEDVDLESFLKDAVRYDNLLIETEGTIESVIGYMCSNPVYRFLIEKEGDEKARNLLNQMKTDILEELGREANDLNENGDLKVPVILNCNLIMGRR